MNFLKTIKNRKRGGLLENTLMLYILQFSNMFIVFFTRGYQTRVLGMDTMGFISIAQSIMMFFALFIDFGFLLSATARISKFREDKEYLSKTLACVTYSKFILIGISSVFFFAVIAPAFSTTREYVVNCIFLASTALGSLLPDYMYRGLEKMSVITLRTVTIKFITALMIFVFIKDPGDYYMVPLFAALGNFGALAYAFFHLYKRLDIRLCRVSAGEIWSTIKGSSQFVVSRVASTVYGQANTIILGMVNSTLAGAYASADAVMIAAKNCVSPISDSLYPHMMKNRNFSLIRKALLFIMPIMTVGCAVVFIFAEPLCKIWLGERDGDLVVLPMRALMPVALLAFPNFVLGFPTLGAMGLEKYANLSIVTATCVHLIFVGALYFTGNISMILLCLSASFSELLVLLIRIVVIYRHRDQLRQQTVQEVAT